MGRRVIVGAWLVMLVVVSSCRVRDWRSDRALWEAASRVEPVTNRTWGRLGRWGEILQRQDRPALRQPFSSRLRPQSLKYDTADGSYREAR